MCGAGYSRYFFRAMQIAWIKPPWPARPVNRFSDYLCTGSIGAALFGDPAVKWAESPAMLPEEKQYRAA
jgi:hypothetical protein